MSLNLDQVLIIDNGAYTMKAGWSHIHSQEDNGENQLIAAIPNFYDSFSNNESYFNSERRDYHSLLNAITKGKGGKGAYISEEIQNCRDYSTLSYRLPFHRGYLINWQVQSLIWNYAFSSNNLLKCNPEETNLLLTEPLFNLPNIQDTYDEIIFEDFGFNSYCRVNAPFLASIKHGSMTRIPVLEPFSQETLNGLENNLSQTKQTLILNAHESTPSNNEKEDRKHSEMNDSESSDLPMKEESVSTMNEPQKPESENPENEKPENEESENGKPAENEKVENDKAHKKPKNEIFMNEKSENEKPADERAHNETSDEKPENENERAQNEKSETENLKNENPETEAEIVTNEIAPFVGLGNEKNMDKPEEEIQNENENENGTKTELSTESQNKNENENEMDLDEPANPRMEENGHESEESETMNEISNGINTRSPKNNRKNHVSQCQLIIDSGYSFTHIIPFFNGFKLNYAIKRIQVGGKVLTNYLKEIISFRQWNMMEESYLVNEVKEKCSFISSDLYRDLDISKHSKRNQNPILLEYVLPDLRKHKHGFVRKPESIDPLTRDPQEQILYMNNERFTVPELLFSPSDIGLNQAGLVETIIQSINLTPKELHGFFYSNIVVVGGNARIPGFKHRLESDLRKVAPSSFPVHVMIPRDPVGFAWKGGRELVNNQELNGNLSQLFVTKSEYSEYGSSICKRRFIL